MADDQIVQDTPVQAETDTTTSGETSENATPDPMAEMEARLEAKYAAKVEEVSRKFQSISDRDIKAANREAAGHRREADTSRSIIDSMRNDPTIKQRLPYYENKAAADAYRQQEDGRADEEAKREYFEITRDRIADLGIDVNDSRLDWADDATDIRKATDRILRSVAKIQKADSGKLKESILKEVREELKDKEANLRREAGIESVDSTIGKGGGSDADFLEKWGAGEVPYTKENLERANKLIYE